MKQLGGLDSAFVYGETPTMPMSVCALAILDTSTAGPATFERLRSLLGERSPDLGMLRHQLARVPGALARPFWVDDPDYDVDRHLHSVHLPEGSDERSLARLVGEIASHPLRRDRPLWETWLIEGWAPEREAVVMKAHHSAIDGVSGTKLMAHLLDLNPADNGSGTPSAAGSGTATPGRLALVRAGLSGQVLEPVAVAKLAATVALKLATVACSLARRDARRTTMAKPFTAPRTSFNAALTARRSIAFADVALGDVSRVKGAFGVKVNDVITAIVGGALRRYLMEHGELPSRPLIAAVPVSVHAQVGGARGTTRVSVMFSALATDIDDPVERLHRVAAANAIAKDVQRMVGAGTLTQLTEHIPPLLMRVGTRLYSSLRLADYHPVVHNLILSNVAGPPVELYLAGARVVGLYPLGPLTDGAGLNVTALSQGDRLGFGVVTCPDLVPDVWQIAGAIPDALEELVERVRPEG